MDHHGAQGSESTIGGTADYESVNLSADRRKIVFCAYASNGYYQIFTSNTDATQITQLTRDLEDHWEAHFSPDGTKIVYVRGFGALGLMNTSGGPEKTVDTDRFYIDHPIILSNGKILFEGFDSEMDQFFTVNQDGTGLMSFTNTLSTPSYYFEDIAVSPDGKKIAFSAYDRGTETDNVFIADFNAAALDTYETVLSNIVQLTTTSPVADRSMDPMFVDDRIVFVTFGDTEPVGAGDYMEIYSMKYDGSDLQRLTKNTDYEWFMVPYYYYSN